jgi:hypothetical protein
MNQFVQTEEMSGQKNSKFKEAFW